ncbi:hypothetical protein GPL00_05615 [Dorea formicigenerans]|nr:hypothetical protein [Dorea formicigenerans]
MGNSKSGLPIFEIRKTTRLQRVFSDATGYLSVKCQKCKNVHILNLAYF